MRQLTYALSMAAALLIGVDGWQMAQAQPQDKGGGPPAGRGAPGGGPPGGAAKGPAPSGPQRAAPAPSGQRDAGPRQEGPRAGRMDDGPRRVERTRDRDGDRAVRTRDRDGDRTVRTRDRDGDRTRVIVRDRDGDRTVRTRDRDGDRTRIIVRDRNDGDARRRGDRTRIIVRPGSRADRHTHRRWRSGSHWSWVIVPSIEIGEYLDWCHYHRWSARGMVRHSSVRCHRHDNWDHRSIRYVAGYY